MAYDDREYSRYGSDQSQGYGGYGSQSYGRHSRYDSYDQGREDDSGYDRQALQAMPKTREEAQEYFRRQQEENLRNMQSTDVESRDGKSSFLGVTVSKDMKPLLEVGLDTVRPLLINFSKNINGIASGSAKRLGFAKSHSKAGLVAENVFRWGLVGSKQIFDVVTASNKYRGERKELYENLSPVMNATGANLKNNEIVQVAYNDLHQNWISDLKKVAADIPTMIPTAIFAMQDQAASAKTRAAAGVHHDDAAAAASHTAKEAGKIVDKMKAVDKAFNGELELAAQTYGKDTPDFKRHETLINKAREQALENAQHADLHGAADTSQKYGMGFGAQNGSFDAAMFSAIPLAGIFTQKLKSGINKDQKARNSRPRAWKLIEHLKEEMDAQCGDLRSRTNEYGECDREYKAQHPEDIQVSGIGHNDGRTMNLKEYIVELFQQHERDRDPKRDFYDQKTGQVIDPLKGTMLTNLMPLVDIIADNVANGTIAPNALYKLVGENKVIQHKDSGARVFTKDSELKNLIEQELAPVLGTRESVKMEEFMAKFANPAQVQQTLKDNLESMQGVERALFASMFPDDILLQVGVKKKEILEIRKKAHEFSTDFVASNVVHLSKKSPEDLKKMGVTENEIDTINSMAERIEKGDVEALKLAVTGHNKELIDAVRTAGLLEQIGEKTEGKKFWSERVKEMSATRSHMKENAEKFKEEGGQEEDRDSGRDKYSRKERVKSRGGRDRDYDDSDYNESRSNSRSRKSSWVDREDDGFREDSRSSRGGYSAGKSRRDSYAESVHDNEPDFYRGY